jgi:type VI protein secretion system component VasF
MTRNLMSVLPRERREVWIETRYAAVAIVDETVNGHGHADDDLPHHAVLDATP